MKLNKTTHYNISIALLFLIFVGTSIVPVIGSIDETTNNEDNQKKDEIKEGMRRNVDDYPGIEICYHKNRLKNSYHNWSEASKNLDSANKENDPIKIEASLRELEKQKNLTKRDAIAYRQFCLERPEVRDFVETSDEKHICGDLCDANDWALIE
tara:strand:+ start:11785 stop:12246 length:462 start_codon:yes stop_codon:yes gene_type:complete